MLAETAIVFAILSGQPTVVEYHGHLSYSYDPRLANEISLDEARRRIERGKTPVLFAMVGGPVKRATKKQGLALLDKWTEQLNLKRQGKAAGKITVLIATTLIAVVLGLVVWTSRYLGYMWRPRLFPTPMLAGSIPAGALRNVARSS